MHVTHHGKPITLITQKVNVGETAKRTYLVDTTLSTVDLFDMAAGKIRLILTVPSVDTSICACEILRFSKEIADLPISYQSQLSTFVVSADLPFAQKRWLNSESISNITALSDYRDMDFARAWGVFIKELGLFARAVFIIDQSNTILYKEIVPEITDQPFYDVILDTLKSKLQTLTATKI